MAEKLQEHFVGSKEHQRMKDHARRGETQATGISSGDPQTRRDAIAKARYSQIK